MYIYIYRERERSVVVVRSRVFVFDAEVEIHNRLLRRPFGRVRCWMNEAKHNTTMRFQEKQQFM